MSRIRSIGIIIVDSVELHEGSLRASAYVGAKAHPAKIVHYYHIDDYPVKRLVVRASSARSADLYEPVAASPVLYLEC